MGNEVLSQNEVTRVWSWPLTCI